MVNKIKKRIFTESWKKNMSIARLGKLSWNKGKKLSKKHIKKLSESHLGQVAWNKGIKLPYKVWNKGIINPNITGDKHPNWKGGVNPTYARAVLKKKNGGSHTQSEWDTLKAQYNWTCPCCKRQEPNIKLSKDHIIALSKGGSDNIENLQPLCVSCNAKKYTKFVKYEVIFNN